MVPFHIYEWERSCPHLHLKPIKPATYGGGIANLETRSVFENRFWEGLTNRLRCNYASRKSRILRAVTRVKGGKIANNRRAPVPLDWVRILYMVRMDVQADIFFLSGNITWEKLCSSRLRITMESVILGRVLMAEMVTTSGGE